MVLLLFSLLAVTSKKQINKQKHCVLVLHTVDATCSHSFNSIFSYESYKRIFLDLDGLAIRLTNKKKVNKQRNKTKTKKINKNTQKYYERKMGKK